MRCLLVLLLLLGACVERRLFIKTDPPGALVRVNGREIGRAPATWRFDHYGKVRVEAELDAHLSTEQVVELEAPGREWILGGFITDVLWPGTIRDDHEVTVRLKRVPKRAEAAVKRELSGLASRATKLRSEAQKR